MDKNLIEMTNAEVTDLLLYKIDKGFKNEIEDVAHHVWNRLEDKIYEDMSLYMKTIGSHQDVPRMRDVYRQMRNEIKADNYMQKGDFTGHFAYCRGRK